MGKLAVIMLRDHSPSAPSGAEIFFPTVGRCDPSRTARCAFGQCVQASDGDQAGKAALRDGQIVHHPGDQIAGLAIDYGFRLIILARDDWQATRGSFVNHFGDPSQIEGGKKTSARWYSCLRPSVPSNPANTTLVSFSCCFRSFNSVAIKPSPTKTKSACGKRAAASSSSCGC